MADSTPPGGARHFLDSASGRPLHPAAREVLLAALDQGWADPLRLHREGRNARLLLDNAREVVASLLGCRPDEVGFTGSGTAACHVALAGVWSGRRGARAPEQPSRTAAGGPGSVGASDAGTAVVTSAVEHSAVLAGAATLPDARPVLVAVDSRGRVDLDGWEAALAGGARVAALQAANHEVGTLQPLAAAHAACAERGIPLVVDAAAALGWAAVPDTWDVLCASAHKWGGPAGVGVLATRRRSRWRPPGPEDERDQATPGFVNVPGVLAAAAALQAVEAERDRTVATCRSLTDRLRAELPRLVPDLDLAGDPDRSLPHIVNFSCLYVDGEALVTELDRAGFAVSSGSACTSSALEPSHVLTAMGVLTHGNVRVSCLPDTPPAAMAEFAGTVARVVADLRGRAGVTR